MLKLYYAPGSCALASHIALEESGGTYEAARVNLRGNEQRTPEYLKINPKGRVPALATPQGILTETPAILAFIAQSFPLSGIAPVGDPFEFARAQAINSYLCSTVHVAHAHRVRGYRWADDPAAIEELKRKTPEVMADCFALIEREMLAGPWVLGAGYSICDPYLFTITRWLEGDGVDFRRFPKVSEHHDRMLTRPAVRKVLADEAAA